MYLYEFAAIIGYLIILLFIAYLSYRRSMSAQDFIIGSRSLNRWQTALAVHASDMSSWLFMAYPATIFLTGMQGAWAAVGLLVFMYLNWQFVAPKIRVATEQYNSLTFSSYFESRLADTSGKIRIFTALMSLFFYTIYICAALVGMGLLVETLFDIDYYYGIIMGIVIVIPYVFTGGYVTLAWIDLFQGLFLLAVIICVPLYILPQMGGFDAISSAARMKQLSISFFPNFSGSTLMTIFFTIMGWGLGYFGQPHIVTKFMGIKHVNEIPKAKLIGMTWMVLSLGAATLVGLIGIAYFQQGGLQTPEQLFIMMVKDSFHPLLVGLILCAIIATTINAMSSQVLVLSSTMAEDLYKRVFRKDASSRELLFVSRMGVVIVTIVSFLIAIGRFSTIQSLVLYAWSGIGSSFGPLVLFSLYSKRINKYGAWAGILAGGSVSAAWPLFDKTVPTMIPGFVASVVAILIVSHLTRNIHPHLTNAK